MGASMRCLLLLVLSIAFIRGEARAADLDLNPHMVRAYRMLLSERGSRGYSLSDYFTQDLNYGRRTGVIKAHRAPLTMCNAAVTETIVEAINLYASDNPAWSPEAVIPPESWNTFGFTGLKSHMFSHNLMEYPPLEGIPASEIPQSLKTDIQKFHSEKGMAYAIEKFGIGQKIDFKTAKPGDIVTFDRTNDTRSGTPKYSGHSVVFLGFVNRNQDLTETYDERSVVGFKYFSSQGSRETGGLAERWAYFRGMCPVRVGYQLPDDIHAAGCSDRVDNARNRAANGVEKAGQINDCCLDKVTPSSGPRVGRLFSPVRWTYAASQQRIAQDYASLRDRIQEFVRNRGNASVRLMLIARGAVALEGESPRIAQRYITQVNQRFSVDLRAIAREDSASIAPAQLSQIARITPRPVIDSANRQVTVAVRDTFQEKIKNAENSAIERLKSAETTGIANSRLDSSHIQ